MHVIFYIIIFILPAIFFFWMLPFISELTLGNDYQLFSIYHQLELMLSIKAGSFPLYAPGFAGGQSASALTLGQLYHPISHAAALLPGYWSGKALEWSTVLRLVSLSAAHLGLFTFLRRIKLSLLMAFILSMVTVYNLRMLDLFRYGAALESWTGHLFLCAALGMFCLKPTRIKGPIFIVGATYWLVCSGHPQMMYYGMFGAAIFALVIPYFLIEIIPDRDPSSRNILHFWLNSSLFIVLGILLASAYVVPYYFDFVLSNAGRFARDYSWADTYRDTFVGTLNNFFYPLRSDAMGAFGGSSLFFITALIPLVKLFRLKIPTIIWIVWGIFLLAFLHMQGGRTVVHFLAWKFLPLASSMRIAGRISMILPVLMMLLLGWVVTSQPSDGGSNRFDNRLNTRLILAFLALCLFFAYSLIPDRITAETTVYSARSINEIPAWIEPVVFWGGIGTFISLALYGFVRKNKLFAELLLCFCACVQIMSLLPYGTWSEAKKDTPDLARMLRYKENSMSYQLQVPGSGLASKVVIRQMQESFLEPFLGKIYKRFLFADNNEQAYELMDLYRTPNLVVLEGPKVNMENGAPAISNRREINQVNLKHSSFNRLEFKIHASHPSFFGMGYPFTGHWKGILNGSPAPIHRANGAAHAVLVPAGQSHLEFRYWSWAAFWGMVLSCVAIGVLGSFIGFRLLPLRYALLAAVSAFLIGLAAILLWYQSLYSGKNFQTKYAWNAQFSAADSNIAYNKKTSMSSRLLPNYSYLFASNQAVDGNRAPGSGFSTKFQSEPWWIVDLKSSKLIGRIVLYESRRSPNVNKRPLVVKISEDGETWGPGTHVSQEDQTSPIILNLEQPVAARYILIRASGNCHLSFDEVEIFPTG